MLKLIGCIFIIAASTAAGFMLADRLSKRLIQLKELQRAIVQLQNEIMFTRTALPEACYKVAVKSKEPISSFFREVSDILLKNKTDSVFEAFNQVLDSKKEELSFSNGDMDILIDLSKALGDSDIEGHRKVFALTEDGLKRNIEDAYNIFKKSSKMYRYLGFSFGAVIVILLI